MKIVSIKIPEELDERLLAVARERRLSRSKLIRDILASSLPDSSHPDEHSAFYELKQTLGIVRSGVSDLATADEHLEGFGK
ncbi:MAG: CopG family transcriptional regulator [Rhodothermales bacterium]